MDFLIGAFMMWEYVVFVTIISILGEEKEQKRGLYLLSISYEVYKRSNLFT